MRIWNCGTNQLHGKIEREIGRYDTQREIRVNHSSLDSPFMVGVALWLCEREREESGDV